MYHLKRKHKIVCDTIDQYMAQGLVVFRGGQGAGGQQVANPEWRFFSPDFPDSPGFFRIFSRILTIIILSCQNMNKQKICHKFFPVKKPQKTILLLCYYIPTYCKLFKKFGWRKKKEVCFDFFVMLRVISWSICNIHLVSDCTVLHKIKRRKIVQALSPRIFLSTVDKIIGTKYICTKYVDRNYNIHLQNTTTLLPIIQELFFHVIIFFVLLKLKTYIVFLRKNIS